MISSHASEPIYESTLAVARRSACAVLHALVGSLLDAFATFGAA